jgi:orotate phosphoribosyltransferase
MTIFNQQEFVTFALDNDVVGFFNEPIRLASGRLSNCYVNWRSVMSDVFLTDKLSNFVIAYTMDSGLEPECFCGVPEGATKLGIITQYKWATTSPDYGKHSHALSMGRANPKRRDTIEDRLFVGKPRGKTIVLEDTTTTGNSLLATINNLTDAQVPIIAAFGLTDRMELRDDGLSAAQAVQRIGIPYFALSNAMELLPAAYRRQAPEVHIAVAVEKEFETYGIRPLSLR